MARTNRKPSTVMADVVKALKDCSYGDVWCADADHLKTQEDINATAGAGFVFFTLDPSEFVDDQADQYDEHQIMDGFADVRDDVNWADHYIGRTIAISGKTKIEFDLRTVYRAAIKYGRAIAHSIKLAAHIDRIMTKQGKDYEIELSVDETATPTTLAEHFIIAEQCLRSNVKLVSLAPRYLGRFENGVDYLGDIGAFSNSIAEHAAIAKALGPYKLSLHNGSDKLSIYRVFARKTEGRFHVKTAGTSYLESLRVAARYEPALFRRVVDYARDNFEKDRASYCISAELDKVPTTAAIRDDHELERLYLDQNAGRQILHVTFGSVLTHSGLGPMVRDVLVAHPKPYREILTAHFSKHLHALSEGLP